MKNHYWKRSGRCQAVTTGTNLLHYIYIEVSLKALVTNYIFVLCVRHMQKIKQAGYPAVTRIAAQTLAVLAALAATVHEGRVPGEVLPVALALCLFSAVAAWVWVPTERGHVIRFVPAFALAGWIAMTPAVGLWICLAGLLVNPNAISGRISVRSANTLAILVAILMTYGAARLFSAPGGLIPPVPSMIQAPVLYLLLSGISVGVGWFVLGILDRSPTPPGGRFSIHAVFLEMLNIPLAILLASFIVPVLWSCSHA